LILFTGSAIVRARRTEKGVGVIAVERFESVSELAARVAEDLELERHLIDA